MSAHDSSSRRPRNTPGIFLLADPLAGQRFPHRNRAGIAGALDFNTNCITSVPRHSARRQRCIDRFTAPAMWVSAFRVAPANASLHAREAPPKGDRCSSNHECEVQTRLRARAAELGSVATHSVYDYEHVDRMFDARYARAPSRSFRCRNTTRTVNLIDQCSIMKGKTFVR